MGTKVRFLNSRPAQCIFVVALLVAMTILIIWRIHIVWEDPLYQSPSPPTIPYPKKDM